MELRELKALELAARAQIVLDGGAWIVPSQSGKSPYKVTTWPGAESCQCDDFQLRQKPCKHVLACQLVEERDGKRPAPPIDTTSIPKRPTYAQDWPAYNLAQSTEKHRLQVMLVDLCRGIPEPPAAKTGRRPVSMADRLFSSIFKVYSTVSSRRFACDLNDSRDAGYLSRPVHHNKVNCFLESPDLTDPLRQLVERSAMPLRAVETDFAVDSSGFSTSKFVRWFDHKYGVEKVEHDWVKVHICVGVRTGIVTAVEIKDRDAADSPQFRPLVETTATSFKISEVSADKAYLSAVNVDAVVAHGGAAFIAPKANTTGGVGGEFEKMYHYYSYRRDEFLRHYHKRSNVEAVFSAVKRKFGDAIRSKSEVAMVNEALAKFVCHNLCCVILSQIELGIDADFWAEEGQDDEPRDVLRMTTAR